MRRGRGVRIGSGIEAELGKLTLGQGKLCGVSCRRRRRSGWNGESEEGIVISQPEHGGRGNCEGEGSSAGIPFRTRISCEVVRESLGESLSRNIGYEAFLDEMPKEMKRDSSPSSSKLWQHRLILFEEAMTVHRQALPWATRYARHKTTTHQLQHPWAGASHFWKRPPPYGSLEKFGDSMKR